MPFGIDTRMLLRWLSRRTSKIRCIPETFSEHFYQLSRTVSEFLSQLSRSCFVPTRRNRRYDFSASTMSKSAQQMADEIFAGFFRDLKWSCHKLPEGSTIPPMECVSYHIFAGQIAPLLFRFGRLQEVIVQMSVALFDDRRQPFHAMLQRFYASGCHNAFCDLMVEKLAPALSNEYNGKFVIVIGVLLNS